MIVDAEKTGKLKPGLSTLIGASCARVFCLFVCAPQLQLIVVCPLTPNAVVCALQTEPTAGNTGLGIALTSAARGYKTLFTIPDKMSQEKVDLLKAFGSTVVRTSSSAPHGSPESYDGKAKVLQQEIADSVILDQVKVLCDLSIVLWREDGRALLGLLFPRPIPQFLNLVQWCTQFANPSNSAVHAETTAVEIIEACKKTPSASASASAAPLHYVVAGAGSGGTITGLSQTIKKQFPSVKVCLCL